MDGRPSPEPNPADASAEAGSLAALAPVRLVELSLLRDHPRAALVPEMSAQDYRTLLLDIQERGLLTPLDVTAEHVVLDGRHRLRAARELGLSEAPVRVVCPEDEVAHMVLAAVNRRHLSESQRAALAVELADYQRLRQQARQRSVANLVQFPERATLPTRLGRSRDLLARLAGTSPRPIQDAQTVFDADPDLFARVKAGELPVHRAAQQIRRERQRAALPKSVPLPEGPFQVIYADPPWASDSPTSNWAPENHYPTMTLEEIKALSVPAADDAVLFLWVPSGLLPAGLDVMSAWGFSYKTELVWVKPSIGLGVWARQRHEPLLLGRRGSLPPPEPPTRPDSVIEAARGRHSQKPAAVYERIERMYPDATKLELFARGKPRPGWAAWGNEVEAA